MAVSSGRGAEPGSTPEERLLDAAERLLVSVGYARITTRRLADEAGVNHGLVHYYFGSNDNLLVQALERFTERLIARQSDLYASDLPFVEKWRTAMRFLTRATSATRRSGSNCKRSDGTILTCGNGWQGSTTNGGRCLPTAFETPHRELGIPIPLDAVVALVMTFNMGLIVERLGGVETGHKELLEWIDRWLSSSV